MTIRKSCMRLLVIPAFLGTAMVQAHISFAKPTAGAGSHYVGLLRVTHGCAGSPTLSIRVEVPAGIDVARPQPKAGWTLSIERAPLAKSIRSDGGEVRERVTAITWTGRLDADQFDEFGLMLKLPDTPGVLYFPTVQRCETGRNDWTMIPAAGQSWHSVKSPAPMLEVGPADPVHMEHMRP